MSVREDFPAKLSSNCETAHSNLGLSPISALSLPATMSVCWLYYYYYYYQLIYNCDTWDLLTSQSDLTASD